MQNNALFYPHISLQNPDLIKAMALYYDNIYRIVPNGVIPEDSLDLQPFLEEGSIGKCIDPSIYSKKASEEFISKLGMWNAAALDNNPEDQRTITKLHTGKIDQSVRELFTEVGFKEENDWIYVPTEIASNFMLFMANDIASKNQLSLMTADWGAWTGTSYFGVDGKINDYIYNIGKDTAIEKQSGNFGLFGLMLSELVPINISEIPAEKIIKFREQRSGEISQFRKCIIDLRAELTKLESDEIRLDVIEAKAKQLAKAQAEYKSSADLLKVKGWCGVTMMGFPAPIIFGQLMSIPTASTVALGATGIAIGGLFNILNTKKELKKLNEKHPESFLFELRRSFKHYTSKRGGGDINFHAYNCMEEYVND